MHCVVRGTLYGAWSITNTSPTRLIGASHEQLWLLCTGYNLLLHQCQVQMNLFLRFNIIVFKEVQIANFWWKVRKITLIIEKRLIHVPPRKCHCIASADSQFQNGRANASSPMRLPTIRSWKWSIMRCQGKKNNVLWISIERLECGWS